MKSKNITSMNSTVLTTMRIIVYKGTTTDQRCATLRSNSGNVRMRHQKQCVNLSKQSMNTLEKKVLVLLSSIQCLWPVTLKSHARPSLTINYSLSWTPELPKKRISSCSWMRQVLKTTFFSWDKAMTSIFIKLPTSKHTMMTTQAQMVYWLLST